jgi:hypothetical protein
MMLLCCCTAALRALSACTGRYLLHHEYMNVQRMRESQASLHLDGGGAKCT